MEVMDPQDFKHTTLKHYPGSRVNRKTTPERIGITLLDEKPGFTGIYIRNEFGGLWPARTVNRSNKAHHDAVCKAWLDHVGINEDRRSTRFVKFMSDRSATWVSKSGKSEKSMPLEKGQIRLVKVDENPRAPKGKGWPKIWEIWDGNWSTYIKPNEITSFFPTGLTEIDEIDRQKGE